MHLQSFYSYPNERLRGKDAARELVSMLCEQDVWHGSSIAKARNRFQYIGLRVTSNEDFVCEYQNRSPLSCA